MSFSVSVFCVALLCLSVSVLAKSESTSSSQNNEVEPTPVRIDPILRRALLKALNDIDKENPPDEEDDSTATDGPSPTTDFEEDDLEETTPGDSQKVHFHSFVVNSRKGQNISTLLQARFNSASASENTESSNIDSDDDFEDDVQINFPNSDEKDIETRSVSSSVNVNQVKDETKKEKASKIGSAVTQQTTITKEPSPSPSPPPPPPPEHNEDGENIEKVEDKVQFIQAPLVAAFTVHQDEQGLPRSVVPIYKEHQQQSQQLIQQKQQQSQIQLQSSIHQPFDQLSVQRALEQKQRLLEQQLFLLQQQQRQQELLLRQQQEYHEQQLLQRQQQFLQDQQRQQIRIEEEKRRQQALEQQRNLQQENLLRVTQYQQQQQQRQVLQNQQLQQQRLPAASTDIISFQPSIVLPFNGQLPNREAVDFLSNIHQQVTNQLPLQQNVSPQFNNILTGHQLPPSRDSVPFSSFRTQVQIQPSLQQPNRVFRSESQTGNFGFNNNFIPQQRFRDSTNQNQLQNLLFQSGFNQGGKSQEDLNIVSKVLSLNHGLGVSQNTFPNFLFGESRRYVTKVKPPTKFFYKQF